MDVLEGERYLTWAHNPNKMVSLAQDDRFWEEYDSEHAEERWQIHYELAAEASKGRRQAKERAVRRPGGPRRWPYPAVQKDERREARRAAVRMRGATRRAEAAIRTARMIAIPAPAPLPPSGGPSAELEAG